jgi:hypothetical protein
VFVKYANSLRNMGKDRHHMPRFMFNALPLKDQTSRTSHVHCAHSVISCPWDNEISK